MHKLKGTNLFQHAPSYICVEGCSPESQVITLGEWSPDSPWNVFTESYCLCSAVCPSASVCWLYTVRALFSLRGAAVRCYYRKDCSMIDWKAAPQEVWGENEGQYALRCIGGCQIMMKSPSRCTMQYANILEGYRGDIWLMNSNFKRLLKVL